MILPFWLLGDHLGSTATTANADGTFHSEVRYSAFGEIRDSSGTMTTDYLYTGQREEAEVGLYYYVARWYDPAIGRFIQADSIIPNPGSAKGFDRYAYVYNNPLRYVDPSGHEPLMDGITSVVNAVANAWTYAKDVLKGFSKTWNKRWCKMGLSEVAKTISAIKATDQMFKGYGFSFNDAMGTSEKTLTLYKTHDQSNLWGQTEKDGSSVTFFFDGSDDFNFSIGLIVHEFGHVFDYRHNPNNSFAMGLGSTDWMGYEYSNGLGITDTLYSLGLFEGDLGVFGGGENLYYFGSYEAGNPGDVQVEQFADMFLMLVMDYSLPKGDSNYFYYSKRFSFMRSGNARVVE